MAADLETIKKIEKIIGKKLKSITLDQIYTFDNGYMVDESEGVIGLNVNKSMLSDISFLKDLKNLSHLSLDQNQITDITPLKDLKKLTLLVLENNPLTDLSPLKDLKNLKELYLRNNNISQLPADIGEWESPMEIKWEFDYKGGIILEGNPLEIPPVEIVKQGRKAVTVYFKALEGEKRALNEVKVLLVGDGGAGKTSLVKRLLEEGYDPNQSQTHGIDIRYWQVKAKKEKIKVRIWDFGGQEIMHATHQFFLSKRSLYILVLDCRKDAKIEYWLKHINTFGGNSPVLVVINKIDENPAFDVNRVFLQEKYKNIKGFFRVSCAANDGIKKFSQHLVNQLAQVELISTTWAKTWFNMKERLEKMKKHFISYDEYKVLCRQEKIIDKIAQDTLVDYLNDLGIILHFKDFKLKETHVLDPEWVTTAVYKIINSKDIAAMRGLLKLELLEDVLKKKTRKDYDYPPDKHKYIIDLMQKFELCYEIDTSTILIPDLLELQQPVFDFDYETALKFLVEYDFLPRSIMPRFIVKMHRDIKNRYQWRSGVVLADETFQATAVVICDDEAKTIFIYVQGTQKRDYFAIILKNLRDIHRTFEKLDEVEKVPMPDATHVTTSYEHLLTLENMGIKEFVPDGSKKKYNVKELLGTVYTEKNTEAEILQILKKLQDKFDTEETLLKKADDFFMLQPNIMGIGVNVNKLPQLVKKLFKKKHE
jgi:internalin A